MSKMDADIQQQIRHEVVNAVAQSQNNDNFEPTTPFLSDQKNLTLSLNFVG
jgi:hypothetical protein